MTRSFSELEVGVKLEVAAKVISDNGGIIKVDFQPPPDVKESSSVVAGLVLARFGYESKNGYRPQKRY
jgi:hypothetical protein